MPTPRADENRDDFVKRCIPIVLGEGTADDSDQAVAVCHSMWEEHTGEGMPMDKQKLFLEATVAPSGEQPTGREWEVTIIGAQEPEQLVTAEGREFIRSLNGRLYAVDKIEESAPLWDGVKVYDDHLTQEEFEKRHGMRSPKNEWLGSIVQPRFVREGGLPQLRAVFKVVEDALARKLKNAWDQGILHTIGLSIDTFPIVGGEATVEGRRLPIIEGFNKILSVDLVGNPAAGGGFNRLIAAAIEQNEEIDMDENTDAIDALREELVALIKEEVGSAVAEAQVKADVEEMGDEEVAEELADRKKAEAEKELVEIQRRKDEARRETDLARTELVLERELDKARLPEKFEEAVRAQFAGRIAEKADIQKAIKLQKDAHASLDPTGRVNAGGSDIHVGVGADDRVELEFTRLMMGNTAFKSLEHSDDEAVQERIKETTAYKSWVNNGKPELPHYPSVSALLYDWFGGNPILDARAMEAATTSSLSSVVKNAVNVMSANRYSQREQWWDPITMTEEVDTIDQATLVRTYGVDSLDVVNEGAAYTELAMADQEETADFVKRGNYIGVTLEALMRDKIQEIRRIPQILADAWFNTQSDLVANVFTVNSNAGPVLGDTGALFNATAVATTGGHANLLTDALSHSAYSAARVAMRKQTDQIEGAGRKLLLRPRYLLVPVDLETTALEIRNAELVPDADFDAASDSGAQTPNLFRGEFDVVVVPSWTDANDWALVADPQQAPAIWLIYPRGQRTPQIFSADNEQGGTMFTNDELRYKVRLMTYRFSATYDCAPVSDFRPLHKSNVS